MDQQAQAFTVHSAWTAKAVQEIVSVKRNTAVNQEKTTAS